jgi:uncharacterized protein DUF1206
MSLTRPLTALAASNAARSAGRAALSASENPWVERLSRYGHVVRGVIYVLPGLIALRLALGVHGPAMTQTGAIDMIGRQPYGRGLLVAIAVGLAGYSVWGVIRAVLDPLHKGHSAVGVAQRLGYVTSALAYAGLFVATLRYLAGTLRHMAKPHDWTADLLAKPFGAWLVGIIGLCWIGAGIAEMARGWRGSFERDLNLGRITSDERRWAMTLGHFGIVSRGVVFAIIGILLIAAGLHAGPYHASGLDSALLVLARQPHGRLLLAAAGLGLMTFGVFSMMCARWARVRGSAPAPGSHASQPSFARGSS